MSKVDEKELKAVAHLKDARISNRKVNIVADLIRGKAVSDAEDILKFTNKAAAPLLLKLLKSAEANAENNHHMKVENLYIDEIYANEGKTMYRARPRAKGSAFRIAKRTSHITIVLKEKE